METADIVDVSIELPEDQAEALAQFLKRVTWGEMRACAADEAECYRIRAALTTLGAALADAGYAPA